MTPRGTGLGFVFVSGFGFWVLGFGFWVFGFWGVLGFGVLGLVVCFVVFLVLGFGWVLGFWGWFGFWFWVWGFWVLGFGFWFGFCFGCLWFWCFGVLVYSLRFWFITVLFETYHGWRQRRCAFSGGHEVRSRGHAPAAPTKQPAPMTPVASDMPHPPRQRNNPPQ